MSHHMEEALQTPALLEGRRLALVVGINGSTKMNTFLALLESAEKNARTMAQVLQDCCQCELIHDPLTGSAVTTNAFRYALNMLAKGCSDQDVLILYFAGHLLSLL